MKTLARVVACMMLFVSIAQAQGNSFTQIRYNGGTIATKVKPDDWKNKLTVGSDVITLTLKDGQKLQITPSKISSLTYGQEAHRRVGTMVALGIIFAPLALFGLFHKTRLHYIGVQFTDEKGAESGVLIQGHKSNYRAVLFALQSVSKQPVAVAEADRQFVPVGVTSQVAPEVKSN